MSATKPDAVKPEDLENLIELFNRSAWDEMHLKTDTLEIFLSNDPNARRPAAAPATAAAAVAAPTAAAVPATTAAAPAATHTIPDGMIAIRAPNLGTFYRAPKPGAPAYVEIGQQIEESTEVCLIEVMKLFTPVHAGLRGIVRQVLAKDGQMVEFDEPLIVIEPN
ncbi:MAG: acetyl-CoA carboxylase biotin carboxyl carrier protein [Gammaproteobacteria bacterium]|nr:acetyl-CoA carboxylase biotin carboxyl carrier protein [Gammaproteobacteria bacterium]MBI5614967.1 acetyl-CoA carboxylase biotin carboxyl carrier protein [Gammaproteobacteria bacterium]